MKKSAGILLYRRKSGRLEVLLVHPGGPFWVKKDSGAWTIPKGQLQEEEGPLDTAIREFEEETGHKLEGPFHPLDPVRQKGGKLVHAWAVEGDIDARQIESNTFELEWPPRSGRIELFPEVDRAEWFDLKTASQKINPAQAKLLLDLEQAGLT